MVLCFRKDFEFFVRKHLQSCLFSHFYKHKHSNKQKIVIANNTHRVVNLYSKFKFEISKSKQFNDIFRVVKIVCLLRGRDESMFIEMENYDITFLMLLFPFAEKRKIENRFEI